MSSSHACKTGMIDVQIRAKFTDELHGANQTFGILVYQIRDVFSRLN